MQYHSPMVTSQQQNNSFLCYRNSRILSYPFKHLPSFPTWSPTFTELFILRLKLLQLFLGKSPMAIEKCPEFLDCCALKFKKKKLSLVENLPSNFWFGYGNSVGKHGLKLIFNMKNRMESGDRPFQSLTNSFSTTGLAGSGGNPHTPFSEASKGIETKTKKPKH